MFSIDNTLIEQEVGEEAVKILFEELDGDFLQKYKKIRDLVMQKRIGEEYLLSRRVICPQPKLTDKYNNVDEDKICLLTTDLVIRGEAILLMLSKQLGVNVMKRYNEIKKSIIKKKLKKKRSRNELCLNWIHTHTKTEIPLYNLMPCIKKNFIKIVERVKYWIICIYSVFYEKFLNFSSLSWKK